MSLFGDILSFGLKSKAAKKEDALKAQLLNQMTASSAGLFDKRYDALNASDSRITDLLGKQHGETAANDANTFSYLLGQGQKGFDEQIDNSNTAFDKEYAAKDTLMTAQKAAREANQKVADAERARQTGFQGQADAIAGWIPGGVGMDAHDAARTKHAGIRAGLVNDAMTKVAGPDVGGDAALKTAFGSAAGRSSDMAVGDALRAAGLASYGDADRGINRRLGQFAGDLGGVNLKAELSRSALPAELGVGRVDAANAKDRYDFVSSLAKDVGDRTGQMMSDYRTHNAGSRQQFSDAFQKLLDDYYGSSMGSESSYIDGFVNSNQNQDNKISNLYNFKMGNTSVTSPLANTVSMFDKAIEKAVAGR